MANEFLDLLAVRLHGIETEPHLTPADYIQLARDSASEAACVADSLDLVGELLSSHSLTKRQDERGGFLVQRLAVVMGQLVSNTEHALSLLQRAYPEFDPKAPPASPSVTKED